MELATEELERAQQRAAELSLERDTLVARLEAAQAAAQAGGSRQDGGAGPGAGEGGGSEQGEADPDSGSGSKEGFWERQVRVRSEQVAALQGQLSSAQQATANAAAQLSMQVRRRAGHAAPAAVLLATAWCHARCSLLLNFVHITRHVAVAAGLTCDTRLHVAQEQSWSNKLASAELSISKLEAELTRRPDPQRYQVGSARQCTHPCVPVPTLQSSDSCWLLGAQELASQVLALQQLIDVQVRAAPAMGVTRPCSAVAQRCSRQHARATTALLGSWCWLDACADGRGGLGPRGAEGCCQEPWPSPRLDVASCEQPTAGVW